MRRMSPRTAACHLAYVPGPRMGGSPSAVWICEYPYRTMRSSGPSSDCADCPIWQQMERQRQTDDAAASGTLCEVAAVS
jgi:hypothetical protein